MQFCNFYDCMQVAEKLMIMHEECLEGNYNSIEKLRQAGPSTGAHQHVRQVIIVSILCMVTWAVLFA